ncbi:hypothetical protein E3T43_10110 [Cryobacterium sp. Hh7]|uniref:hypothetical protein n=1 Tax=Cryobacterium sp. Hh7 TaxID=1259159 RepID=UPI00106CC770|nr:hypothetical protein [Cryobacterium sp. Hh7]TFD55871.1 hypothetical protein E3T43_10110 [Cryobacterium sp. Hh7]
MRGLVRIFLSWFMRALLALAGVAGLYLAAVAMSALVYFWQVVGAAVIIGLGAMMGPKVRNAFRAWRDYPAALARATKLQTALSVSQDSERALRAGVIRASAEGRADGRASAIGELLGSAVPVPQIIAIAEYDGSVSLVVRFDVVEPPLGARFRLIVETTRQLRGMVEVAATEGDRGIAYLLCVEVTSELFWSALSAKVLTDNSPPNGVVLEPPINLLGDPTLLLAINPKKVSDKEIEE